MANKHTYELIKAINKVRTLSGGIKTNSAGVPRNIHGDIIR